jgi:hypothetical protein
MCASNTQVVFGAATGAGVGEIKWGWGGPARGGPALVRTPQVTGIFGQPIGKPKTDAVQLACASGGGG